VLSSAAQLCGNHSGEAERDSGVGLKLFGFIAESMFAFIPKSCSGSSRHAVRHHRGIAFILPRIPHFPVAVKPSGALERRQTSRGYIALAQSIQRYP
jgi:hypothetical protein